MTSTPLPFLMARGAFMMNRVIFGMLAVNPLLRRRWRARQYLADATAVELTRNPTALARALRILGERASIPAGAAWAAHLFVAGADPTTRVSPGGREPPPETTLGAPIAIPVERRGRLHGRSEP